MREAELKYHPPRYSTMERVADSAKADDDYRNISQSILAERSRIEAIPQNNIDRNSRKPRSGRNHLRQISSSWILRWGDSRIGRDVIKDKEVDISN